MRKIENFYLDVRVKNNLDRCPFVLDWFSAKLAELNKLPEQHDRSGIAKGERLPIPKAKYFLALHDIVFKKLPLKEFCSLMGINHGTGRNWRNSDKIFKEIALGFAEEFSHSFLRRYSELVEPRPAEGFFKAFDLICECRHYPMETVEQIKIRLKHYNKQRSDGADSSYALSNINSLLFSVLILSLKTQGTDRRKYIQKLEEKETQEYEAFFQKLREKYRSAEAQEVIDLAESKGNDRKIFYVTVTRAISD